MKAMILAAGKGERMRPLTEKIPKPLLKVDGQPLLAYHLRAILKAGIKEVIINTWYLGEKIIEQIGDGSDYGLQIHYSQEQSLLNTGGGIVNALPLLGNEPFLVVSADVLTDYPLKMLPSTPTGLAHLVMVDNPTYHPTGDFGLERGQISLLCEPKLTYANIGIFRPEFFASAPDGAFPLGALMRKHIANNLVTGQYYSGIWHNIGTPADLEMVNSIV